MCSEQTETDFDPDEIPEYFWQLISDAGKDPDKLYSILMGLPKDQIIEFQASFIEVASELTAEKFLAFIDLGESEDGIEDIVHWVVSQGKAFYMSVWNDPAKIPVHIDVGNRDILYGIADAVYLKKFGETMDLY